jgi:hypothetical protein
VGKGSQEPIALRGEAVLGAEAEPPTGCAVEKGAHEPIALSEVRVGARETVTTFDAEPRRPLETEGLPERDGVDVTDRLTVAWEEAVPPTGWSVGKGSQEPKALRGEGVLGAEARAVAHAVGVRA